MRIGEFSKKHSVTKDTIRHYINLELIIPKKNGSHFFFDNKCSDDLIEVIQLKNLGFSLKEIQKLLIFNRLSGINKTEEDKCYILDILNDKYKELVDRLDHLKISVTKLEDYIIKNNSNHTDDYPKIHKLGLPLQSLDILSCPVCGESLNFSDGLIENNLIMKSRIFCKKCSFTCFIEDGILINLSNEDKNIAQSKPMSIRGNLGEYTDKTPSKFINFMYKAFDWIVAKTNLINNPYNTILELGTGSGFFLRQILNSLDSKTIYIITDINLSRIKEIKKRLEMSGLHKNFIFICSDFLNLPLKKDSIDLVIDYLGSTCYNFEKSGFLMDNITDLLKKNGLWAGSYYYMSSNCNSLKLLSNNVREYYNIKYIEESAKNTKLKLIAEEYLGPVDEAGEYENFLVSGDDLNQKLLVLKNQ